ncbi:MAG: menaquinone biosynthesis protein [Bacteroidota bacterium]|nr:menaquinone biosynthesis protein [Bacteroidota bacterium]
MMEREADCFSLHAKIKGLKKIKVGAVSYLNTKPLLWGIERSEALMNKIELITDYPSSIANMLLDDKIDVGLVPVAVLPKMKEHFIIGDYCIGADGDVASVCLFSDVPLEEIRTILLDYQSRTSVNLCKVLLKNFWQISPQLQDAKEDFRKDIKGTTAGVVIGDRALEQRHQSKYSYDLAGAWKAFTGLPFVFAAWIANKELPSDFCNEFNEANGIGLQQLEKVIKANPFAAYSLQTYYTQNINYNLTEEKRKGLHLFLEMLSEL